MFTDFLGKPVAKGDHIVYAQSAYGGGAMFHKAVVHALVPLVQHPHEPRHLAREDQLNQARPTYFRNKIYEDPAKRYIVQVMRVKNKTVRNENGDWNIPQSQQIIVIA